MTPNNKKLQVEGNPNLYRDKYSGAILNFNLQEIKLSKEKRKDKQKINILETEIVSLKKEINEIKGLISNLIQEIKK
jgi:vacuolar-type H+-ATPase subunit I/STV1